MLGRIISNLSDLPQFFLQLSPVEAQRILLLVLLCKIDSITKHYLPCGDFWLRYMTPCWDMLMWRLGYWFVFGSLIDRLRLSGVDWALDSGNLAIVVDSCNLIQLVSVFFFARRGQAVTRAIVFVVSFSRAVNASVGLIILHQVFQCFLQEQKLIS